MCMYVRICVCVYVCMYRNDDYAEAHGFLYVCMCVCMCVCMYVCIKMMATRRCMASCMYVCVYVCMYKNDGYAEAHGFLYVCMCVCVCVCMYKNDGYTKGILFVSWALFSRAMTVKLLITYLHAYIHTYIHIQTFAAFSSSLLASSSSVLPSA